MSQTFICCLVFLQFYTYNHCEVNTVMLMPVGFSECIFDRLFSERPDTIIFEVSWDFTNPFFVPKYTACVASQSVSYFAQLRCGFDFSPWLDIIYSSFLWHCNINWYLFLLNSSGSGLIWNWRLMPSMARKAELINIVHTQLHSCYPASLPGFGFGKSQHVSYWSFFPSPPLPTPPHPTPAPVYHHLAK